METLEKVFDSIWWDEFLEYTEKMTIPAVFNNCMPKEETALMRACILEILAELARLRTLKYGYRVYLDGMQLRRGDMDKIYDAPPLANETLEEWVIRVFGDKKFGMIINQGERFNLKLSKLIALKLEPFLAKTGIPTEGIIFTLFIGNYESTPLGIHKDLPGKSVMHFHLGPGPKTIYTWDTDKFTNLITHQKYNIKQLDALIPFAKKHQFNEGDIYFMPENIYHIGTQQGLSIGIACWCYNRSNQDFAKRLPSILSENFLMSSDIMLKPDRTPIDDSSGLEKTLDLFNLPEEYKDLTFKDTLRQVYKDLRYSLQSNAGYRTSPFPNPAVYQFSLDDTIEIEKPYKILYHENKDKLNIYVRGIKIEFKNFECIKAFIDEINKGLPLQVNELLKQLDASWPNENGFYLLGLLFAHHGIKVGEPL